MRYVERFGTRCFHQGCTGRGWAEELFFGEGWGKAATKILGAGQGNSQTRGIFGAGAAVLKYFGQGK